MLRYVILGLLRRGATRHGYALMKEYREQSGIEVSIGNVYRELQRLAAEGLVRLVTNPPGADPRRAPYEISAAGSAAFDCWLARSPTRPPGECEDSFSYRAFFLGQDSPAVGRKLLERWQDELALRRKTLERTGEVARPQAADEGWRPFGSLPLLLARRLKHVSAELEFVGELRSAYEAWTAESRNAPGAGSRPPTSRVGGGSNRRPFNNSRRR